MKKSLTAGTLVLVLLLSALFACSCTAKKPSPSVVPSQAPSTAPSETAPSASVAPSIDQPLANFTGETALSLYQKGAAYLRSALYFRAEGEGSVQNTLSSQTMRMLFEKDGERHLNLSYSSGFVNTATEIVALPTGVTVRQGKYDKKTDTASYGTPQSYTAEQFSQNWGGDATYPFCYLFTEETVTASNCAKTSPYEYACTLTLDAHAATAEYKKRMQKSGDISSPTFTSVRFVFTMDGYGRFTSVTIEETYTVKIIFRITCKASLTHRFYYEK